MSAETNSLGTQLPPKFPSTPRRESLAAQGSARTVAWALAHATLLAWALQFIEVKRNGDAAIVTLLVSLSMLIRWLVQPRVLDMIANIPQTCAWYRATITGGVVLLLMRIVGEFDASASHWLGHAESIFAISQLVEQPWMSVLVLGAGLLVNAHGANRLLVEAGGHNGTNDVHWARSRVLFVILLSLFSVLMALFQLLVVSSLEWWRILLFFAVIARGMMRVSFMVDKNTLEAEARTDMGVQRRHMRWNVGMMLIAMASLQTGITYAGILLVVIPKVASMARAAARWLRGVPRSIRGAAKERRFDLGRVIASTSVGSSARAFGFVWIVSMVPAAMIMWQANVSPLACIAGSFAHKSTLTVIYSLDLLVLIASMASTRPSWWGIGSACAVTLITRFGIFLVLPELLAPPTQLVAAASVFGIMHSIPNGMAKIMGWLVAVQLAYCVMLGLNEWCYRMNEQVHHGGSAFELGRPLRLELRIRWALVVLHLCFVAAIPGFFWHFLPSRINWADENHRMIWRFMSASVPILVMGFSLGFSFVSIRAQLRGDNPIQQQCRRYQRWFGDDLLPRLRRQCPWVLKYGIENSHRVWNRGWIIPATELVLASLLSVMSYHLMISRLTP